MRVVLADDSDLILERLLEVVSQNKNVEIIGSFKNGTDTLKALRIHKPDLAIIDFKMPGLNGLEVLHEIRKEDKAIKFIILTFYSSYYFQHLAIQAGVDYFFSKVDDFDKVSKVVAELILNENKATCI